MSMAISSNPEWQRPAAVPAKAPPLPAPAHIARPVFEVRWMKLMAAFPASFPADDDARKGKRALWVELLDANEWITTAIFQRGATILAFGHKGNFLPEPATTLEYFRRAAALIRDETQKALPPPPAEPPSTGEEAMARYRVMVATSAARGKALHARQRQIVGEALSMGLKYGTDAMSSFVREKYGRAVRGEG